MMPQREIGANGPITIDRTSPVPLYFQLAQYYESAIRSGDGDRAVRADLALRHHRHPGRS